MALETFSRWLGKSSAAGNRVQLRAKERYRKHLLSRSEHLWIKEDKYAMRIFDILIDSLDTATLKALNKLDIYFTVGEGRLACTITPPKRANIVMIYPNLLQLMRSGAPTHAVAVLAHEIGHIVLNHNKRSISPLQAQLEADRFAAEAGFADELHDVLLDHKEWPFCEERLTALEPALQTPKLAA